jgi:hypothetical protein
MIMEKDFCNNIEYGVEKGRFYVRSFEYPDLIVYADTLRMAFDLYLQKFD